MTVNIESKRGLFKLILTIDDLPKTAQPALEISYSKRKIKEDIIW